MIPPACWGVVCSVTFYVLTKLLCILSSYSRRHTKSISMFEKDNLSPISEKDETEEEVRDKWIPKKKHDVLKAKYKCLKKLFQIYDASVIGILPEAYGEGDSCRAPGEERRPPHRRRRCGCSKENACGSTSELASTGYPALCSDDRDSSLGATFGEARGANEAIGRTEELMAYNMAVSTGDAPPQYSWQNHCPITTVKESKPTRFQLFLQRLFGLRRERPMKLALPDEQVMVKSENDITRGCPRRRRRTLRFRRMRLIKKTQSDIALTDMRSPMILSFMQSVQKSCLLDRTPRQCPIAGCNNMFYGIINYNDHLNLCHFVERKFVCHFCHEGFETESDKKGHENEHLGLSRLSEPARAAADTAENTRRASNTQTDPELTRNASEEKLIRIMSFLDKYVEGGRQSAGVSETHYSDAALRSFEREGDSTASSAGPPRAVPQRRPPPAQRSSTSARASCDLCDESIVCNRELSGHRELTRGDTFSDSSSKIHRSTHRRRSEVKSQTGKIDIESGDEPRHADLSATLSYERRSQVSRNRSDQSHLNVISDQSTNIVNYESKVARQNSRSRVKSGITSYRWEPVTTIIRV